MTDRAAIAVAGAGLIGRRHIEAIRRSSRARLCAIVDPTAEARGIAMAMGVAHHDDISALERADGVILATPTGLHFEQAMICLSRGFPVLVEKPMTRTAAEAVQLERAAAVAGVPILVGHHRRHNPRIAAAKALIERGELGRIVGVHASVLLCKPDDYFQPEWRRQPGAGPLLTNLIHEVDLMRHLVGEISEVRSMVSNAVRGHAVEDSAAIVFGFDSGALGTVLVSDAAVAPWSWELTAEENPQYPPTGQSCMTLSGTRGALEVPNLRFWRHHDGRNSWYQPMEAVAVASEDADPLVRQIDHFVAVFRGEVPPLVSASDGARAVSVVEAVVASGATPGTPVGVEGTS